MKKIILFSLLLIGSSTKVNAHTHNILLDRTFWKKNPTISSIHKKIEEGNSATALNKHGFDAVVYAILEQVDFPTIQYLLNIRGNEVNKLTHDKRTYVFWAASKSNTSLMRYLIKNGAKMNLKDSHHFSVATFAAATGQTSKEIYEICIANGIDLKKDVDENEANALLLIAPYVKDFKLFDYFQKQGLDITNVDKYNNGVFNYATRAGNMLMLEKLILIGLPYKKINNKGQNAMFFASEGTRSKKNKLPLFQYLESLGLKASQIDNGGNTPLHKLAYSNKNIDVFNFFLAKGLSPDLKNNKGNTPLMNAAYRNNIQIVTLLTQASKNINVKNKLGKSALTNAISSNTNDIVTFLLEQGADITIKDNKNNNLSYYLINGYNPKKEVIFSQKLETLKKAKFNFKQPQHNSNNLHHLVANKSINLVRLLSNFNIDINAKNKDGFTPLHLAAMSGKNDLILKHFIKLGANKKTKTNLKESAYMLGSENELFKKNNIDLKFLR